MRSVAECEIILERKGNDLWLKYIMELIWLRRALDQNIVKEGQYSEILQKIANRYAEMVKDT